MDCFAGGGTTLGAAQELGRQWIGADNSPESLSAVIRRFRDGLQDYGDYVSKPFDQPELTLKTETDGTRFSLSSPSMRRRTKLCQSSNQSAKNGAGEYPGPIHIS